MTKLRYEPITLKAANLGGVNPMPDLKNVSYIHAKCDTTANVTEEDKKYFGKGKIETLLPYLSQDEYDRNVSEKKFKAAILENEYLKAVFLPELGGRLWSLYHKKLKKELLYVNDVVQPCNLALRNAWVAGGVEWNVGIKGHSPFTCETLFTAEYENENGGKILAMYEYERIRGIVYGINAYLPDDDDKLYIRTSVENRTDNSPYMYWWSNVAVPEKGVRVFTDADTMFSCTYEDNHYLIDKIKAPNFAGVDISYPERAPHAGDVFFRTHETPRRWVAALEKDGTGLLQYSTPELIGRKIFFWGNGTGGKNWNRFLTNSNRKYIEVQAGLLCTQQEHIKMPPNTVWSWTECYTAMSLDKDKLHGEWHDVSRKISEYVNTLPDPHDAPIPLNSEKKLIYFGSGWGSLEGEKISRFYKFPKESLGAEEKKWLFLRKEGYLKYESSEKPPMSYMVDVETLKLLEKSKESPLGKHWLTELHIGIIKYMQNDNEGAECAWKASAEMEKNPWAYRNLAMLYKNILSDKAAAAEYMKKAVDACKMPCRGLYTDAAVVLSDCGCYDEWIDIFNSLPGDMKMLGRLRIYTAICHMRKGDAETAKKYINEDFKMTDIKEGELSITAVWKELYGDEKPLPDNLNFKMYEIS